MAEVKPFEKDDFRTLEIIKEAFVNCSFTDSQLILNGMKKLFGDGDLTLTENKEANTIQVNCKSYTYIAQHYNRKFIFKHKKEEDGNCLIVSVSEA